MRFTWRLAALFAAGMVLFLLSGFSEYFALAGVVYDVILVALVLTDLLLTARPDRAFEVERLVEDRLSLGAPNRVIVRVRFIGERMAQPGKVLARDEPPLAFDVQGER